MIVKLALLLMVGLAVAGCGDGPDQAGSPAPSPTSGTGSTPVSASSTPPTTTTTDGAMVEAAVADLATRLEVDPSAIRVVSFEHVTWRDGSLGCPQPGMLYTQALVDGTRTVLAAVGEEFSYHAGADGAPFLCEEPVLPPLPAGDR